MDDVWVSQKDEWWSQQDRNYIKDGSVIGTREMMANLTIKQIEDYVGKEFAGSGNIKIRVAEKLPDNRDTTLIKTISTWD